MAVRVIAMIGLAYCRVTSTTDTSPAKSVNIAAKAMDQPLSFWNEGTKSATGAVSTMEYPDCSMGESARTVTPFLPSTQDFSPALPLMALALLGTRSASFFPVESSSDEMTIRPFWSTRCSRLC